MTITDKNAAVRAVQLGAKMQDEPDIVSYRELFRRARLAALEYHLSAVRLVAAALPDDAPRPVSVVDATVKP